MVPVTMLDFLLVEYCETREICVIPSNWLSCEVDSENYHGSFFPRTHSQKVLERYAKTRVNPGKLWHSYKCRILFEGAHYESCEDYLEQILEDNSSAKEAVECPPAEVPDSETEQSNIPVAATVQEHQLTSGNQDVGIHANELSRTELTVATTSAVDSEQEEMPPQAAIQKICSEVEPLSFKVTGVQQPSATEEPKHDSESEVETKSHSDDEIHGSDFAEDSLDGSDLLNLSELHSSVVSSAVCHSGIEDSSEEFSDVEQREERRRQKKVMRIKSKKPMRPCYYCGKFISYIKRHLETVHSSEEDVKEALGLDKKEKMKKFDFLRKRGMYKHNLKMIKENKPISYFRWSDLDNNAVLMYFKEAIENVSQHGTKGSLPGKSEILKFLDENPNFGEGIAIRKKITIIKTKLFNERTKLRSAYFSKLASVE